MSILLMSKLVKAQYQMKALLILQDIPVWIKHSRVYHVRRLLPIDISHDEPLSVLLHWTGLLPLIIIIIFFFTCLYYIVL